MGFGIKSADVDAIKERTDRLPDSPADQVTSLAVKARTDNLAGEAPAAAAITAAWQSGVATSLLAGADLVTIGAAGLRRKVHSLLVNIGGLTVGANITVRMYTTGEAGMINVYNQTFIVGTDPPGLWIINGSLEIDDPLRVECQSNQVGDDGRDIGYKYDLEDM